MTTYLGKICSFGLPRVPCVNCRQFVYLVISLLVLRAGCGIWLHQFLIIAYLFTCNEGYGLKLSIKLVGAWCSVFGRANRGSNVWMSAALTFQCWSCCCVLFLFHLSVESWFICLLFWWIVELEVLHADRITCFFMNHSRTYGEGCVHKQNGLSPPVIY